MLEGMESRIKFALLTLQREEKRINDLEWPLPNITPPWLSSAIYQLELSLTDLQGWRWAVQACLSGAQISAPPGGKKVQDS